MRTGVRTIAAIRAARRNGIFMRTKITQKNAVRNDAPDRRKPWPFGPLRGMKLPWRYRYAPPWLSLAAEVWPSARRFVGHALACPAIEAFQPTARASLAGTR